jgi:hypothetical protein
MRSLARPGSPVLLASFFVLLWVASTRLLVKEARLGWHIADGWNLMYQAATNAFNYPEFGFVRRGLAGTLIFWSGLDPLSGSVALHLVSAASLAALGCWLIHRSGRGVLEQAVHAGVLLVLVMFWAEDAGRIDMAVATLLAAGAMALHARRPVWAALALVLALAVHENGFIFGLPLALAVVLGQGRDAWRDRRGALMAGVGVIALVTLAYAFFDRLPRASNAEIAETIRGRLPTHVLVEWAIYFATSGMRGVRASICQNLEINPNYGLQIVCAMVVLAVATTCLAGRDRRAWPLVALAALPPLAFLIAVANDMSRWTMLACFNAWLITLLRPSGAAVPPAAHWRVPMLRFALVGVLLVLSHPKVPLRAPIPIYSPSPFLEYLAMRAGAPTTPDVGVALEHCDPAWREVLQQRGRR